MVLGLETRQRGFTFYFFLKIKTISCHFQDSTVLKKIAISCHFQDDKKHFLVSFEMKKKIHVTFLDWKNKFIVTF